jgi:hypothetical protein
MSKHRTIPMVRRTRDLSRNMPRGLDREQLTPEEIRLFAVNDEPFYRQRYFPIVKNFAKKIQKGIFNKNKAKPFIKKSVLPDIKKRYDEQLKVESDITDRDQASDVLLNTIISDAEEHIRFKQSKGEKI